MYLELEVWNTGPYAIPKEHIYQKYRIGSTEMTIIECKDIDCKEDATIIQELNKTAIQLDRINDFLILNGLDKFAIRSSLFYEDTERHFILFDGKRFISSKELEIVEVFIEWDGQNQRYHERAASFLFELTVTKQSIAIAGYQIFKVYKKAGEIVNELYFISERSSARVLFGSVYTIEEILKFLLPDQVLTITKKIWEVGTLNGKVTPKLVGISEFANLLGWSKPRLSGKYLRQQEGKCLRPPLPYPVQILSATPLWTLEQALEFKSLVKRKKS